MVRSRSPYARPARIEEEASRRRPACDPHQGLRGDHGRRGLRFRRTHQGKLFPPLRQQGPARGRRGQALRRDGGGRVLEGPVPEARRPARAAAGVRRLPQGHAEARARRVHLPPRDDGAGDLRDASFHPQGVRPPHQRARGEPPCGHRRSQTALRAAREVEPREPRPVYAGRDPGRVRPREGQARIRGRRRMPRAPAALSRASVRSTEGVNAMSKHHGKFIWYDVMTSDCKAAESFYRRALGWSAQDSGMGDRSYTLFSAGPAMVGGLMPIPDQAKKMGVPPRWTGYVAVDDVDGYAARVKKADGAVHRGPEDI